MPVHPRDIPPSFWQLIAAAQSDPDAYQAQLDALSQDALHRFYWTYRFAMGVLKWSPYVDQLDPTLSGDSTEDVCMWIVAQGQAYYLAIIEDPERMPYDVDDPDDGLLALNMALRTYRRRFDAPMDFPEDEDFLFPT